MEELLIDKDISACQRKLSPEEYCQLEENILRDGEVIDELIVWRGKNMLVDGENRYSIAKKHKLKYRIREVDFDDKKAVLDWVVKHQLGRRNLDGIAASLLRARVAAEEETVALAAEKVGVSRRQMFRDKSVAATVDDLPDDLKDRLNQGSLIASGRSMTKLSQLSDVEKKKVYHALRSDATKSLDDVLPAKKKSSFTERESEIIKQAVSPRIRRSLECGTIVATSADIRKLDTLPDHAKETINTLLEMGDVESLGEAMEMLPKPAKRQPAAPDVEKMRNKIEDTFAALMRLVDDYGIALSLSVEPVQDALKIARGNLP